MTRVKSKNIHGTGTNESPWSRDKGARCGQTHIAHKVILEKAIKIDRKKVWGGSIGLSLWDK
jgi:hypothetical protein